MYRQPTSPVSVQSGSFDSFLCITICSICPLLHGDMHLYFWLTSSIEANMQNIRRQLFANSSANLQLCYTFGSVQQILQCWGTFLGVDHYVIRMPFRTLASNPKLGPIDFVAFIGIRASALIAHRRRAQHSSELSTYINARSVLRQKPLAQLRTSIGHVYPSRSACTGCPVSSVPPWLSSAAYVYGCDYSSCCSNRGLDVCAVAPERSIRTTID